MNNMLDPHLSYLMCCPIRVRKLTPLVQRSMQPTWPPGSSCTYTFSGTLQHTFCIQFLGMLAVFTLELFSIILFSLFSIRNEIGWKSVCISAWCSGQVHPCTRQTCTLIGLSQRECPCEAGHPEVLTNFCSKSVNCLCWSWGVNNQCREDQQSLHMKRWSPLCMKRQLPLCMKKATASAHEKAIAFVDPGEGINNWHREDQQSTFTWKIQKI